MLEFKIPAMSCGHCVAAVTRAVKATDPNAEVVVDLATHRVTVESTAQRAALQDALTEAGYPPA